MANLPEELLVMTFSYLHIDQPVKDTNLYVAVEPSEAQIRTRTLVSLCLASNVCYRIASPLLYRYLNVPGPGRTANLILRSCVENPKLALAVEHLEIGCRVTKEQIDDGDAVLPESGLENVLTIQSQALHGLLPYPEGLRHQLCHWLDRGLQDSEVAILLAVCPNLDFLDLTAVPNLKATLLMQAIEWVVCRENRNDTSHQAGDAPTQALGRPLSKLRTVSVQHWDTEDCTDLSEFASILRLADLETFHGFSIGLSEESTFSHQLLPNSSNITRAYFENSMFDASGIKRFLIACPRLEVFEMEWGSSDMVDDEIRFNEIGEVLRQHGKQLHGLVLRVQDAWFIQNGDETIHHPLGDLSSMTYLEHLTVPEMALFGLDDTEDEEFLNFRKPKAEEIIPKNLKSLTVTDCTDEAATRDLFIQLNSSIALTLQG